MIQLRPYQDATIAGIREKFKAGNKRVVMCLPTGGGKTICFTKMTLDTLQKHPERRVLILTDRIELCVQTFKTLRNFAIEPEVYNAQAHRSKPVTSRCVVAMVETVKRRHKTGSLNIGSFDLIIIDEAHKRNFNAIFEIWPDAFYIGATATPVSSSKKDPMKNYWHDIVEEVDVIGLISDDFLAPVVAYHFLLIDESKLKKDSRKGDYTEKSQADEFGKPAVFAGMLKAYQEQAEGLKTLVFCANIESTEQTAANFRAAGYEAMSITSKDSSEHREKAKDWFHNSESGILVNCGILTTGYDHPPIECIILNRATMSIPLFMQMCGRGSRLSPNKERFIILDCGGNIKRMGTWDEDRKWITKFHNPPKPGPAQPPAVKECPKCNAIVAARVMDCPACGYIWEPQEKELVEGELEQVKAIPPEIQGKKASQLTIREIETVRQIKGYKVGWALRIIRARYGADGLRRYAQLRKYKSGWVQHNLNGPTEFSDRKIY